jgi:hypothetical protein
MGEYIATLIEIMQGRSRSAFVAEVICQVRRRWLASPFQSVARYLLKGLK